MRFRFLKFGRDGDLRDRRPQPGCELQCLTYTCNIARVRQTRWRGQIDIPEQMRRLMLLCNIACEVGNISARWVAR